MPTPNFKLLTSHQLCPLDLKKCQPVAVSVSDEQDVFNTTGACQGASSTSIHGVGGTVSRDTQKKSKSTDLSSLHASGTSRMVQKTVGVAAVSTGWVSHVIQAQRKPVKIKTSVSGNNSETRYSVTNNPQKTRITDDRLTKAGQGFTKAEKWSKVSLCFSDKRKKPEEKNLRKRTWTEAGSDDDEFDQLCNMVDLSFDANVFSDQGTGVTTPDNSQGGGQSVHHTTSTAIGSMRRTWTCPVCNEQFEGRLVHTARLKICYLTFLTSIHTLLHQIFNNLQENVLKIFFIELP